MMHTDDKVVTSAVEANGVNPVPDQERYGKPAGLFPIWFSWNVSILGITYGIYVYSLGLTVWQAIAAGILGYIISSAIVGIIAAAAPKTGLPTLTQTRFAFGYKGNVLPAFFAYFSNMGWQVIIISLSSTTAAYLLSNIWPEMFAGGEGKPTTLCLLGCFIFCLAITMTVAIYGHKLIMVVEHYIAWVTGAASILFMFFVLPQIHWQKLGAASASGDMMTFIGGVVLAMTIVGLGFISNGGDFARYLPRKTPASKVIFWTTTGISLPVAVLLVIGVLLAASNPELSDAAAMEPIAALTRLLPFWFYVPFSIVIIISLVAASMTGIYSSGLGLLSLGLPASRLTTTLINSVIIALGAFYLVFISDRFSATFQAFLAVISVIVGTMGAIQLIDFIRQKRLNWRVEMANPAGQGGFNYRWSALITLLLASFIGMGLITSADPYIDNVVGFLLTEEGKKSVFASSNVGVIIAMIVGAFIYSLCLLVAKFELSPPANKKV